MARKKKRSAFQTCLEFAAVRLLGAILTTVPFALSVKLCQGVGLLVCLLDKRHRRRATAQAKMALGLDEAESARLARRMYIHFGTCVAEFLRLPNYKTSEDIDRIMDWNGNKEIVRNLKAEGKGIIWATGHIGNWEFAGHMGAVTGIMTAAVARPLDNPLIDRYVKSIRTACGQKVIDKKGAMRDVLRELKAGQGVGLITDQDGGQRGIFVPFFGIVSSSIPSAADLAIRTGVPVLTGVMRRVGKPLRFSLEVGRVLRANPDADYEEERHRLMTLINEDMEAHIRKGPEQWIWMHRRWKTRPPDETENPEPVAGS